MRPASTVPLSLIRMPCIVSGKMQQSPSRIEIFGNHLFKKLGRNPVGVHASLQRQHPEVVTLGVNGANLPGSLSQACLIRDPSNIK